MELPHTLPIVKATAATVTGAGYILWAVGTWWIPFLVIFGIWRHLVHHVPVRYTTALWSIVFPLGMYSTASMTFGATFKAIFMIDAGRIGTVIAVLAWVAVAVLAAHTFLQSLRQDKDHGSPNGDTRF